METTRGMSALGYGRPSLTIQVTDRTYTAHQSDAPIIIGREFPAQVCIDDERILRTHLRLDCTPDGWVAVDQSRDGVFIGGARQSSVPIREGTTIRLGNPHGIPVSFALGAPAAPEPYTSDDDDAEQTLHSVDPGVAPAGAAVAARREELKLTQRYLARSGIVNAGALIDFEKGRRWPRRATLTKLEDALQWPHGTIARIRCEQPEPDGKETVTMMNTVRVPLMAEAVEVALTTINNAIE